MLIDLGHTEPIGSQTKKPVMADSDYDEALGEWDGDESNGWRFIPYEVEDDEPELPADLSEWPTEQVKVWVARSQPRNKDTGAIAFDISFEYAQWKDHRVSILDLMDLEDNSFPYEEVTEAVNDWIEKAKRFPHTRRNCLCCFKRATKGKVLCQGCHTKFGEVIYAD